jgi:hypothetical protein
MPRLSTDTVRWASILAAAIMMTGCASHHGDEVDAQGRPLNIPREYYPPAGQCRVWYPNRALDHQPLPGPCEVVRQQVYPTGVLIQG